ncbi:hypothetical protein AMJ49_03620 [Parcubacteria bacterium DG_74_2]|nr:MAG: hypothetical protein AMJ49_03620 [Parcubacteria bacterium DG_74_2]
MAKSFKNTDWILVGAILALLAVGILTLSSVSAAFSQEQIGNPYYFLKHQIIYGFLPGIILSLFALKLKLSFFKKLAIIFLLGNLVLMGMVFLPSLGIKRLGATRWVQLGPLSLQPSEFLKITTILYFAAWLSGRGKRRMKENLLAFSIMAAIIAVFLIRQPDISTLGIIILVGILMYFVAGNPLWHSLIMIGGVVIIGVILIKFEPYRFNRILTFLNPEEDPMGIGYQIKQALIAVGSGGVSGAGLGMSRQKFGFLPQSISDSIFAIFAEETGFIGSIVLIFLFLIFLWRGFKIAKEQKDDFSKLLAFGITSWIALQAFINIASMTKVLPLMGMPLPFVSYGGSALISELIGVGILLNISKSTT